MHHFAAHFDDVTPEELEAEITEAIATVRIEERATAVFQEIGVDLRIL